MFKRLVSLVMVSLMLLTLFVGCGKETDDTVKEANGDTTTAASTEKATEAAKDTEAVKAEPVSITYFNFSAGADNAEVLNGMIADFEAENPDVKVVNEAVGYGEYFTQLATKIAANDAPDCFELNMENFLAYSLRGAVKELNPLFESTGIDQTVYSEGVLSACSIEDTLYAVPLSFSTVLLIYNKDLFDQAGVAYPTNEWRWADELAAAEKIRALGDDIYGINQDIQFWEFYKTVQKNGGNLMSEDGKSFTINSPANIEALQHMQDRIWESNVQPTEEQRADRGAQDLFIEGKMGMYYGGVWAFTDLVTRAGNVNWDVEVEPGNVAKASHFFANVGCISTTTDKDEAAFRFLNYIASNAKAVERRVSAQWELPTINDPAMLAAYLEITPPTNKAAVFESLDYAVKPPALEQFAELVEIMTPKLDSVRDNLMTPKEALDAAQEEAQASITIN
ncbi:MAG: sugar ABC transporter substrate-binding protein [Vallitaleaceae bacterium]|nr:sugar ABC transporter substrate-binding protein [Vallitaleaceae bacterium]